MEWIDASIYGLKKSFHPDFLDAYIVDNRYIVENWYHSVCYTGQTYDIEMEELMCDETSGCTIYDKWKNKLYACSFIAEDDTELYSTLNTRNEVIIDTCQQDVINNYSALFI